jgi:hypothetical protein
MIAILPAVLCGHGPNWAQKYTPFDVIPGHAFWLYSQLVGPGIVANYAAFNLD